ncbi:hypothetical protein [Moorena producens]|uniref:hypothetical protein n=1 Tax=Moorena producens TaxID=1155739 RepID=UPI003C75A43A
MVFFYWTIKLRISFPSCLLPLASCLLPKAVCSQLKYKPYTNDSDSTQDKPWVELFYDVCSGLASKGATHKQQKYN